MSYLASKITQMGLWGKDRENQVLYYWDSAQMVTAKVVRWGFIPATVVLAAYQTEIPLWSIISPIG